jgi:hypothetical protein
MDILAVALLFYSYHPDTAQLDTAGSLRVYRSYSRMEDEGGYLRIVFSYIEHGIEDNVSRLLPLCHVPICIISQSTA